MDCKPFLVEMSDGIRLSTFVQFPKGEGPWPVIFGRSPYPDLLPSWLEKAKFWADHGYAFVIQECRGTGGSEGEWRPFVNESSDGLDSLNWIVNQKWMNGNVGTYGASYSGVVQWCMADNLPPEVKTMFISVTGIERYKQTYMNGMFRHDIYTFWAVGNSGTESGQSTIELYRKALKIRPHIEMDKRLIGQVLPWYRDWVTQVDQESNYWNSGLWADLKTMPRKITVPIMMIGGWFDHNLEASVLSYLKLPEATRKDSIFIIGPWIHTQDVSGDMDFPNHDKFGPQQDQAALAWFDHHLKGKKLDQLKGSVQTYTVREESWRTWNGWIKHTDCILYYLTAPDGMTGGLELHKPHSGEEISFEYNPDRPVRTKGGAAIMAYLTGESDASPPASVIQDEPGARDDVISFISSVLEEDLRIAGAIRAHLFVSSDAEDTSFTVNVMEIFPDGRTYNIRDGITSLRYRNNATVLCPYRPYDTVAAEIVLWPITWTIKKGSQLRVDISSSNFPAYHAHPNTAGPWAYQKDVKIARQTIHCGDVNASWIEIPTIDYNKFEENKKVGLLDGTALRDQGC